MKINQLKINKYKSITKKVEINNFFDFNILVGPNNAGKTNILDAVELFFNPEREQLKDGDVEIAIKNGEKEYGFSFSDGSFHPPLKDFSSSFVRINHEVSPEKVSQDLEKFKKTDSEKYNKFTESMERYFGNLQMSEELFKASTETKIEAKSWRRMGEGFKRLFVILFYIYNPQFEIILIDEPEIHLHPSVIKKFLKLLHNEELEGTIMMTTHHPTMVQAKFLKNTWRVARDEDRSTTIYKFKRGLDIERLVQEINDDNSAMLFTDKALLVEGVSDSILMRGLIDKFYTGKKDIKVVYSGGVGDINLYEKICKVYNIPYSIMIDGDALDSYWKKRFGEKDHPRKREELKKEGVFVLKGALEDNYPQKYQTEETKPLSALRAAGKIKKEDFESPLMSSLKEVIVNL